MKSNDEFEKYLKSNRPMAPEAPPNEAQRIWARILSDSFVRNQRLRALGLITGMSITAVFVFMFLQYRPPMRDASATYAEAELVNESLGLEFIEGEDINEVVELVSLAD